MFYGCRKLTTIYANTEFNNAEKDKSMFAVCSSLVGGSGTKCISKQYDSSYAHIDAPDKPGYFTSSAANPDSKSKYILGDVNGDGKINAVDASAVLTYYANISTNQEGGFKYVQKMAADVDNNDTINAVDASHILAYYAYVSTTRESIVSLEEYLKKK